MAPRLSKDEKTAIDAVMADIDATNVDPQLQAQVRNDIVEVYAEARTTARRNTKKLILEALGFDTKYSQLTFHGAFDRRNTDLYYSLTPIVDPLIKTLADDINARVEKKFKIEDCELEVLAVSLVADYHRAFNRAVCSYKQKMLEKAEADFEKLMPMILNSATGATGEELHAEFIMNIISGEESTPKLTVDQDLIDKMLKASDE